VKGYLVYQELDRDGREYNCQSHLQKGNGYTLNPTRLENEADYDAAMARLHAVSAAKPAPGTPEHVEMTRLQEAVADYERRTVYLPSIRNKSEDSA